MKNMIDRCYYINLDKRKDRKEHIEKTLKLCGILDISERIEAILTEKNGMLGCTMSHILTLEKFIDSDDNTCLIVEDDLTIHNPEQFITNLTKIFNDKVKFDVIQLSGNHKVLENCEYDFLKKVINSQTTSGYIITKEFAPILLNNFKASLNDQNKNGKIMNNNSLDIYWKKLQPKNNWYTFSPALGIQMPSYSDIEKANANYGV